jgi:hypothetical protein
MAQPRTTAGKPPGVGSAFRRGLMAPSLLMLLIGLAAALAVLIAVQGAVATGRYSRIPEGRFLRMARDDNGAVSWRVAQIKRHPPSGPSVYLLGGSNVRECIPSDQSLSAALGTPGGKPVNVFDLGGDSQDLGQSMAIIDNLPRGPGIVVIAVNQTRLTYTPVDIAKQARGETLLLDSPALRRFVAAHDGPRLWPLTPIVPGALAYAASYIQQNEKTLEHGHLPWHTFDRHRYTTGGILPDARKRGLVAKYLRTKGSPGGAFDHNEPYDAALLEATVRLARERGFRVMLMEPPENSFIVGASFDRFKQVYRPLMTRLAAQPGVTYAAFGGKLGLVDHDFRDITHLVGQGRVKWQRGLVAALTPLLKKLAGGQPNGTG